MGNIQKGSFDIIGAVVEIILDENPELGWILRIQNPSMCTLEVATSSELLALEWMSSIKETSQNASVRVRELCNVY